MVVQVKYHVNEKKTKTLSIKASVKTNGNSWIFRLSQNRFLLRKFGASLSKHFQGRASGERQRLD